MKLLISLLTVAFSISLVLHAQDTEAPELTSIDISPASVDVTSGNQVITATLQITDDDSGFSFGNLILNRPDGTSIDFITISSTDRTSGDELDGTYVVQATIPQYAGPGNWNLGVRINDEDLNEREYGDGLEPFPTPGDEQFTVVNTGTIDSEGPQLASISVSPATIDTSLLPQNLTFTLNVTDNLAGMRFVSFGFFDPSGAQLSNLFGAASITNISAGDKLDGTYEITVAMPQGSAAGEWTINVFMRDQLGNDTSVNAPAGGNFIVNNAGSLGDLSDATDATQYVWTTTGDESPGGELVWFAQSTTTLDGIDAAQSGPIGDDGISDMEVVVTGPGTLHFEWKVDSEDGFDFLTAEVLGGGDSDSITGDIDWTTTSLTIPAGSQTVRFRYEKDSGGSAGADAGWVDRVYFAADSDMELPVLQYVNVSPKPVDLSGGDVQITVTIEVSDDFNGFSDGYLSLLDANQNEYSATTFDSVERVSGDDKFGTYEVTFDIAQSDLQGAPPFAEPGTWSVSVELTEQLTSNTRSYGPIDDPFPLPGAEQFQVSSGVTGAGPILTSINSITPPSVNVTSGPQNVTFNFTITDNDIGFGYGNLSLYDSNGTYVTSVSFDATDRVSGTDANGIYEVTASVPQYGAPGTWFAAFFVSDYSGNNRSYPFDNSFPNPGDEEFTVINSGAVDTVKPVLQSIAFSPSTVDTSSSIQTVTVDISLTDNLSGIGEVALAIYNPSDNFVSSLYRSLNGAGALSSSLQTTLDMPVGSAEGTWRCYLLVRDLAGNSFFYTPAGFTFGTPFPSPFASAAQFTVGPVAGTTFGNFVTTYGLTGPDALLGGNPDKDLFNNALELLLGLNPNIANPPNPALYEVVRVGNEFRINFTIDPSLTVTTSGTHLNVSDGSGTPLMVTGQSGSNLMTGWTNQLPVNITGTTYRVTLPIATAGNGFLRLKIVTP